MPELAQTIRRVLSLPSRGRADLSETNEFLNELLNDPIAWRQRSVTEFTFRAAHHARVASSFQMEFPPELIKRYVNLNHVHSANILLPVVTKPKDALLHFDITGPSGAPATLLPRVSIAGLQADYLEYLIAGRPVAEILGPQSRRLHDAISVFTPFLFRRFRRTNFLWRWIDRPYDSALRAYLREGLEFEVSEIDITRWRARTQGVAKILVSHLDEPPDPYSSSEEVLLAIPLLEPTPPDIAAVDQIVESYCTAIEVANQTGEDAYLSVLAEYGRRYELICEVEVPLLEAFRIKTEEDQPIGLGFTGGMNHQVVIGASRSMHIEARTEDSNVLLGRKVGIRDSHGKQISGRMELVRSTPEGLALYSSDPERPYLAEVFLRLRASYQQLLGSLLLGIASAVTAIIVLGLPEDRFFVASLGVLVVPITVAAAFVLTREENPLAIRLQRKTRIFLSITALALWIVVVASLSSYKAPMRNEQKGESSDPVAKVDGEKGVMDGSQRSKRQRSRGGG